MGGGRIFPRVLVPEAHSYSGTKVTQDWAAGEELLMVLVGVWEKKRRRLGALRLPAACRVPQFHLRNQLRLLQP